MTLAMRCAGLLRRHAAAFADLLWPPVCPACNARAEDARVHYCESCWRTLRPLRAEEHCWELHAGGEPSLRAWAAFAVDGRFLDVLASSKYRSFRNVGRRLAAEAAARVAPLLPACTLVPVPIRADRRRLRGFNQTEDYAAALAARTGFPVRARALRRVRGGPPLAGLPRDRRAAAVRGAFAPGPELPRADGGEFVLVDDVLTTGSTGLACAEALARGGVRATGIVAMGRAFAGERDVPGTDLGWLARL